MYEQIFVLLFLILSNKTFVELRCAKVSTHEDIITVETKKTNEQPEFHTWVTW